MAETAGAAPEPAFELRLLQRRRDLDRTVRAADLLGDLTRIITTLEHVRACDTGWRRAEAEIIARKPAREAQDRNGLTQSEFASVVEWEKRLAERRKGVAHARVAVVDAIARLEAAHRSQADAMELPRPVPVTPRDAALASFAQIEDVLRMDQMLFGTVGAPAMTWLKSRWHSLHLDAEAKLRSMPPQEAPPAHPFAVRAARRAKVDQISFDAVDRRRADVEDARAACAGAVRVWVTAYAEFDRELRHGPLAGVWMQDEASAWRRRAAEARLEASSAAKAALQTEEAPAADMPAAWVELRRVCRARLLDELNAMEAPERASAASAGEVPKAGTATTGAPQTRPSSQDRPPSVRPSRPIVRPTATDAGRPRPGPPASAGPGSGGIERPRPEPPKPHPSAPPKPPDWPPAATPSPGPRPPGRSRRGFER